MKTTGKSRAEVGAAAVPVVGGAIATPAFEITVINRAAGEAGRTIKTVVLNARTGARFEGILACLRRPPLAGADVIMLCEADWQMRRSSRREVAAELAAALGMSFAYGPEFASRRSPQATSSFLGNAILSRAPLIAARLIALPDIPRRRKSWLVGQPRTLIATATFGGRPITLALAHLHSRWDPAGRARQMATVLDAVGPDTPTILGGDFNTTTTRLDSVASISLVPLRMALHPWRFRYPQRYEPLFAQLAAAGFKIDGANVPGKPTFTFSRAIPSPLRPKLDWIALRGLEPVHGSPRVIAARESCFGPRVSDHDFVMCEVRL